jgi:TetR/AcrR family transcriptional repressor of lmrAB and yxaGH operons
MIQLANGMEASNFTLSSPLTTATIETAVTCDRINQACREAFSLILTAFKAKFLAAGFSETQSAELALYVTTVIEGGILMSRTYHQTEPLRLATKYIKVYLENL